MGPVLILGGTAEARWLASELSTQCAVITSLAGRTKTPTDLPGRVRVGGFGGVSGLSAYLRAEGISALVDATHPYAAQMGHHALEAATACEIPYLRLERAPWEAVSGDQWIHFSSALAIATALPELGSKVFLSLGGADLRAFETVQGVSFTLRAIDPPEAFRNRPDVEIILARGPFDLDAETALLSARAIDLIVSRNAGGEATWPKIAAARALGIPVAMIDRPLRPEGPFVTSVSEAMTWVLEKGDVL